MSLKEKAILLLSGGLDSTVSLAEALQRYDVILALTFNYGQRAFGKEIKASRMVSEHYNVPHEIIALPWLAAMLPKAMQPARADKRADPWTPDSVNTDGQFFDAQPVWVPNRNGVFLNIAASYAETLGAQVILFGANAEEGERFPDNTPEFQTRLNAALELSTLSRPRVESPVGALDKPGIVERAVTLSAPLHLVWSCYTDHSHQCGECPSCYRLKQALENVNMDPRIKKRVMFAQLV